MDAFFASVEQLFNPHLRGKPVLICGDPDGRSVVATASYEARPFGIHCGMPVGEARRLCPHATLIEGDPGKYIHISLRVLELLQTVSPLVEPFSIDEAFVEVTGQVRTRPEILGLASRLQQRIQKTVGVTASIGMGPNKFVAKMASGVHKPEGLTCFSRQDFVRHFGPGPVGEIWGVGKATADSLELLGIRTVNDLARAPRELLSGTYGVVGPSLQRVATGQDDSPVVPCHLAPDAKSIGHEHTLDQDESDPEILRGHLLRLSDMVGRRARQDGFSGTVVSLKLRSSRFETLQAQQSLCHPCNDGLEIHRVARALFTRLQQGGVQERHRGRARRGSIRPGALDKIRLIGISLGGLVRQGQDLQQRLFAEEQRYHDMISSVDRLRERWGDRVLMRAGTLLTRNEIQETL
jgi:DNA polymerase-4